MAKLGGYKVLFACAWKELLNNCSLDGVSLNRFFGVDINDEDSRKKFDHSEYDVIVFDEIYLADIRMVAKIKKFCIENPDKIIMATGDTCQLKPIEEYTNTKIYKEYADECINQIFHLGYIKKKIKRLESAEDKVKLEPFKQ